ncbi:MAG: copper chaperone PCu(A)C [Aquisalimonadaceae bacterium]
MRWLILLLLLSVSTVPAQAGQLSVTAPWVREVPPVSRHSAGYMTVVNAGAQSRELVAVHSPLFGSAELHESMEERGMARMQHVAKIVIPAGGEVSLEPGGYHVMLMNRNVDQLASGDSVPLMLRFDDGTEIEVTAPVRRDAPDGGAHHHH